MALAPNKTKLVFTIGPASESPEILRQMLLAGMNIARLNFSHGDFAWHKSIIENLRKASSDIGRQVTILADLPGPKMRIGAFVEEPIELKQGDSFTLTTNDIIGDRQHVSVSFPRLPTVVKPNDHLYINDGYIQLEVVKIAGNNVECRVLIGGELRSRKGLNLPSIKLGVSEFTEHDGECLKFALENGVNAFSQSFVESAADIDAVRKAAADLGYHPFIIAKIERARALINIDEILKAADGLMIARGDLGVETPLENIAVVQKQLIRKANLCGKPVITATQMLASMVNHYRPTRAESTDVANAILDGTDNVMLSEESAMGKFPVQAVEILARIAVATEPSRHEIQLTEYVLADDIHLVDLISRNVWQTVAHIHPVAVCIPTFTGHTARMVSRFKLPVWIAAVSSDATTCTGLQFSYGVLPLHTQDHPADWTPFARNWAKNEGLAEGRMVLIENPSQNKTEANPRVEILDLELPPAGEKTLTDKDKR